MSEARRLALIVSNSQYQDEKLTRLEMPDTDAEALSAVLRDDQIGAFDDVILLKNRPAQEVKERIEVFFGRRLPDDLLLLYFSGHGVLDPNNRLFLATYNTRVDRIRSTAISSSFIADAMDGCRSKRKIVVLDCCHSGAFPKGSKAVPGMTVGTKSAFAGNGYGRIVLTASDATQYAWEDETISGSGGGSRFTHFLVRGLREGEADLNHDGIVTIDELYDYVHTNVLAVASADRPQTPGKWAFEQKGDIVIARNPKPYLAAYGDQLYREIIELIGQQSWTEARNKWEKLQERAPDYVDTHNVQSVLENRRAADELYGEMARAIVLNQWSSVLKTWQKVQQLVPNYVDSQKLVAQARRALEKEEERRRLDEQYEQLTALGKRQAWRQVLDQWQEIAKRDPDYPDRRDLVRRARHELLLQQKQREQENRRRELDGLYERVEALVRRQKWREAQTLWKEIRQIDPTYPDSGGHATKAEFELDRQRAQEKMAARQTQLQSLYEQMAADIAAESWQKAWDRWREIQSVDPAYPDRDNLVSIIVAQPNSPAQLDQRETATKQKGTSLRRIGCLLLSGVFALGVFGVAGIVVLSLIDLDFFGLSSDDGSEQTDPAIIEPGIDDSGGNVDDNGSPDFAEGDFVAPPAGDFSGGCTYRADGFSLPSPNIYYGPFFGQIGSYAIGHDTTGLYTWDSNYGYLGPFILQQPNVWQRLPNTPFLACYDAQGFVYGAFAP